jgi:hypothetical protein
MKAGLILALPLALFICAAAPAGVTFEQGDGRVSILIGGKNVAAYVYNDPAVMRPYFCQVKTPGGIQVTRPYPPDSVANKGNDDHETMHPGLWMAFGDLDGVDYWRNKAAVRHVRFDGPFTEGPTGHFTAINRYENPRGGEPICEETCTYSIYVVPEGYLIAARSAFTSTEEFYFGDQEEMGFGMRVNTPLTVKFGGGEIRNSEGGLNEKGTWGKQAKWCSAGGAIDGRRVGLILMPDPANFRPSWFHSRDYGLIVANPFGQKAMTAPDDDAAPPARSRCKTLGFGVFVFDVPQDRQPDYNQACELYMGATGTHVD